MWPVNHRPLLTIRRFLLTHPVWDVTRVLLLRLLALRKNFYSHIPCGMWRKAERGIPAHHISTHTSRVGCDSKARLSWCIKNKFLLTHPVWDVTPVAGHGNTVSKPFLLTHPVWDVTRQTWERNRGRKFLLTHPVWDVTVQLFYPFKRPFVISTHTSRVGCDIIKHIELCKINYFYSHIPCGMWLICIVLFGCAWHFYSHIPCGMWLRSVSFLVSRLHFYSHIPCGMWQLLSFC